MEKIIIKSQEYPCRVTMGALLRFKRETGRDVSQAKEDISDLITLMWCCTASASNADGVPFDMSLEKFADCLGAQDVEKFGKAIQDSGTGVEKKTTSRNQ